MLKKLLKDKKYRDDFTELKRYAYHRFIHVKSYAVEWNKSFDFINNYNDFKPLSHYFKECKYVIYTPLDEMCKTKNGNLASMTIQKIISKGNNLEECLERTMYFISQVKSYGLMLKVYFATMDSIIELSSDTVITDFRDFNLNDEEIKIMRKALFELRLI